MNTTAAIAGLHDLSVARWAVDTGVARPLRLRARLSGRAVAKAVGVDPHTVVRWEKRQCLPRGAAGARYGELVRTWVGGT